MEDIRKIFLYKTVPSFLSWECNLPFIRFVFEVSTLNELENCLDQSLEDQNDKGVNALQSLYQNRKKYEEGSNQRFIVVHDAPLFFSLLQEIIQEYEKRPHKKLQDSNNFIRSIWLRMGFEDVKNVESFLKKQLSFLKNNSIFPEYEEISSLQNKCVLAYRIHENDEWFETNQNIVFSIRNTSDEAMDYPCDYDFPAIHFELTKENEEATCYIYGIQELGGMKNKQLKEKTQFLRKGMRNKHVSADFLIALSLLMDYLYDCGIYKVQVPILQVFDYPYHRELSSSIKKAFDGYTEEDKIELERLYIQGDRSDKVLDYFHTKKMVERFVDKEDQISYNKVERFLYTFIELMDKTDKIEMVSKPFHESENLILRLKGRTNILGDIEIKKGLK